MDETKRQSLLRSIAVSSGIFTGPVTPQDRVEAYTNLEQFKTYDGRIPFCIELLSQERHQLLVPSTNTAIDLTVSTKLYALGVLQHFLKTGYSCLSEADRLSLRGAVLTAARQLAATPVGGTVGENEARILAMKIASLVADIAVRDFPQRWTTFVTDLFVPVRQGGIWCEAGGGAELEGGSTLVGVKIGLECFKSITEDCTDSDYNAKISTPRRNDVLIGLNEVSSQFLPQMFQLLSEQYSVVSAAKSVLHEMVSYLVTNRRTLSQMTVEERAMYDAQIQRRDRSGRIVADCLVTLEKFCQSMPLEWMLSNRNGCDFVSAFLHMLREDVAQLQVYSVACLEQLVMRKIEFADWMKFITSLPQAVGEANQAAEQHETERAAGEGSAGDREALLTEQLPFHRGLSKMLAHLISAHLAHITTDKEIVSGQGPKFQSLSTFLGLLAEMISHPSGRICGEQINTWIGMLRDPQIVKTKILSPFMGKVLSAYMHHLVRIRWDDVDKQTHPLSRLMDASWNDKDEYDAWLCDIRSKASQLFKFISNTEPMLSASVIRDRVRSLLSAHGNGEPRDHLDPETNQLTTLSEANLQFEGLHQPLDNILQGLPSWSVEEKTIPKDGSYSDPKRNEIRTSVRASLAEVANMVVSWNPSYVWLKFRRVTLLDALKYYWKYDPATLPTGVDALLVYLSAEDDLSPSSAGATPARTGHLSGEVIGLRKKSGVALVSVSKRVPHHLVQWLDVLSERARSLLSSSTLLPPNRMHLYEFLSCVATAVEDPVARSSFISDVLSNALTTLESPEVKETLSSTEGLMAAFGISQAANNPASVTDPSNVQAITGKYVRMFSAINQLLSVGKRCHEAAKKRPNGGIPLQNITPSSTQFVTSSQHNFPDEGPVGIADLALNDPFVPLWPKILPALIQVLNVTLRLWHPEYQAILLRNSIQKYALAISDDEAYLATKQDSSKGGVFGEGGTAGSVVSGWDRRDMNLAPKWSGWFNELRNTCFQMLGLLAAQRVLYAPEVAGMFPNLVSTIVDPAHLRAMEHRHLTQYMKQFLEILLLSCPATLYQTHLAPILGPIFEHVQYRLKSTWSPMIEAMSSNGRVGSAAIKALTSANCLDAAALAARGGEEWFTAYYARGGLFVGDLEAVTAESAVEKVRVELSRTLSDVLQAGLALKGEWALVLANQAKEDQALKKNDPSKLSAGPKTRLGDGGQVNADGTPRGENEAAIEARKNLRINAICQFLLLEDERVAGFLSLSVIQCLGYPDAYTCRRCTRICHRILEVVAWSTRYTPLVGNQMFSIAVKNIVTEPKWMVGIEWDMINLIRDIYCRLVLGQTLLPGGQGPGMQQPKDPNDSRAYEQAKTVEKPLQGGGVLVLPSDLPRQILAGLPGITIHSVDKLESNMAEKRSAKDQKDVLRDLLRVAAENLKKAEGSGGVETGILGRAVAEESLLNQNLRGSAVPDIPEKLVTRSMLMKKEAGKDGPDVPSLGSLFKMT